MSTEAPRPDPRAALHQALGADTAAPAPWPAPELAALAPHFPEFRIEALSGQGGMAAVYRATQLKLDRLVALKVLRPDHALQRQFVDRFLREARALAALNHPHVLTVHDFGERGGFCYLVTEFVDGANLRQLMELGRLSPTEVLRLVPQICAGLQFAHEHGVVHRDIKPENVLVDRFGQVKLADFGLAKLAHAEGEATLTRASMVFGTPHYMAPEQWRGSGAVDHRADIYSLGVVLYELLTGKLPVGTYDPPSKCAAVSPGIDQVVHRSLEQEPDRRYQEVSEVRRDVERESSFAPPRQDVPDASVPRASVPQPLAGMLLLALGIVILLGSLLGLGAFVGQELELTHNREWTLASRRAQTALLEAIRATVATGKAWTGAVPVRQSWHRTEVLDAQSAVAFGLLWTSGTTLVASLLGVWSLRRLRTNGASRGWCLLAAALGWLPWLLLGDILLLSPLSIIRDAGRASLGVAVVGTVIAASHLVLTLWLWRNRTSPLPATTAPPGRGLRLGIAIGCLLVLAGAMGAVVAPRTPALADTEPVPMRPSELVGRSRHQVLRSLGPPEAIRLSAHAMTWAYRALDGTLVADALEIANDQVVRASASGSPLVPGAIPDDGPVLGQDLQPFLAGRPAPVQTTEGALCTELTFADGLRVRAHGGALVGFERK